MRYFYTFLFLVYVVAVTKVAVGADSPELRTLGSYSRLFIPLTGTPNYKIQNAAPNKLELQIENMKLPLEWGMQAGVEDQRVKKISYEQSSLNSIRVNVLFSNSNQEYFSYVQSAPPAIVIDIWPQKAGAVVAAKTVDQTKKKKATRSIASVQSTKAHDVEHQELLEVKPLSWDFDFYQKFPLPMPEFTFKGDKFSIPPSTAVEKNWTWSKLSADLPESVNFNLAVILFQKEKFGLAIRTIELTKIEYPESEYLDEMSLLQGMAYKRLGEINEKVALIEKGEEIFRTLMLKTNKDGQLLPISSVLRIYFAAKAYKKEQWLDALEQFEYIAKTLQEKDADYPGISMAMADSYMHMHQFRRSERIFRYVAEKFAGKQIGKEATYRLGNLLAIEEKYERTIVEIEAAYKKYPDYIDKRPETLYNLAEAYFWQKQFAKSKERLQEFVKKFPTQTIASFAHIRLGEIAELDKKDLENAYKHYLDAINGYPFSEGSQIASVRMARLNVRSEKDLDYQVNVMKEILKKKNISKSLTQMTQSVMMLYLLKAEKVNEAVDMARMGMKDYSGNAYEVFKNFYVKALFSRLKYLAKLNQYNDAIQLFETEKKWLLLAGADVYKVMAGIYRDLNLYDTSNKYVQSYEAEAKKQTGRWLASSKESKEILLEKAKNSFKEEKYEDVLSFLSESIASNEAQFMKAISNFQLKRFQESYKLADKLFPIYLSEKSSATENIILLADILLDRAEKERNYRSMEEVLVELRAKIGNKEQRYEFLYADSLWYQRKFRAAITAYTKALEANPKSIYGDRAKYNMAMSNISLGRRPAAVKLLTELRDSSQNIWSQSAKQELELIDWESKYSTVLRNLPPSGIGVVN